MFTGSSLSAIVCEFCRVIIEETSPEKPAAPKKGAEAKAHGTPTPRSIPVPPSPKAETAKSAFKEGSLADAASEAQSESAPSTPGRHPPPQAPSARHDPSISAPAQVPPPSPLPLLPKWGCICLVRM